MQSLQLVGKGTSRSCDCQTGSPAEWKTTWKWFLKNGFVRGKPFFSCVETYVDAGPAGYVSATHNRDVPWAIAKAGRSNIVQNVEISLMAPHLMLHHPYSTHQHRFNSAFFGVQRFMCLKQFWKSAVKVKDPRLANRPKCLHAGWETRTIPISLHANAVPAVGRQGHFAIV